MALFVLLSIGNRVHKITKKLWNHNPVKSAITLIQKTEKNQLKNDRKKRYNKTLNKKESSL